MKYNLFKTCFIGACITAVEIVAMQNGHDGQILMVVLGILGALAGNAGLKVWKEARSKGGNSTA